MSHVDIEFSREIWENIIEVGEWLDECMPNPPTDQPERWLIANGQDDRWGIRFYNKEDATLFVLRWGFK